jgi:hypothetical protein
VTRDPAGLSTVTKMLLEHLVQSGGNREPASTTAASVSAGQRR